ncbi:hypothetical protein [Kribbella sp. DT2]|uniref:hypothetical protein n=1 Tax=Kribbella sp. DT2 TaxID=3393427 RepID=UPI003CF2DC61
MKTRKLWAALALTVAATGVAPASPAHAADGLDSVRVYYPSDLGNGGHVLTRLDFVSRTEVVYRSFTVRDVCPGDSLPVRGRVEWRYTDGSIGYGAWRNVTSGCSSSGTSFGDIRVSRTKAIASARVTVCVYTASGGNRGCATSTGRDNQFS